LLDVDQFRQIVPFAEAGSFTVAVLPDTSGQVGGHAGIEDAIVAIGHDVDPPAALHSLPPTSSRRKPGPRAYKPGASSYPPRHPGERRNLMQPSPTLHPTTPSSRRTPGSHAAKPDATPRGPGFRRDDAIPGPTPRTD